MILKQKIDNNELLKISELIKSIKKNMEKTEKKYNILNSQKEININLILNYLKNNSNNESEYIKVNTETDTASNSFIKNIKIIN